MRLIAAAFFVYISFLWLLGGNPDLPVILKVVIGGVILFITRLIYDETFIRTLRGISFEDHIERLLSDEKAVIEKFQVSEAITFEDLGTSCLCHLLRVGDDKLICLYGQYLYDYIEIDDDPELNQERSFPTSTFSLVRNIKTREVMEIYLGHKVCLLYTSPSPRDLSTSRMPSSA